jgi:hypothetical protein
MVDQVHDGGEDLLVDGGFNLNREQSTCALRASPTSSQEMAIKFCEPMPSLFSSAMTWCRIFSMFSVLLRLKIKALAVFLIEKASLKF